MSRQSQVPLRIVPFKQVDVFTALPYGGNPVAVVLDAESLSTAEMQHIAAWTNLSETTFMLTPTNPQASYRLRIFTPRQELPFAGHPSVGSAHAALEAGFIRRRPDGTLLQECAAGLLPIRIEGTDAMRRLFVRAPVAKVDDPDLTLSVALAKALGVTIEQDPAPRAVTLGPTWIVVDLGDADTVRGLKPNMARVAELCADYGNAVGVSVFGRTGRNDTQLAVRSFAPADGIPEDPVCGSGNAAVAAFLRETGKVNGIGAEYAVSQGREVGRDGTVHVRVGMDGHIEIGGTCVTCVDGTIRL